MLSFASPIKEQADSYGYSKTTNPEKYRNFCQTLGAKARAKNPNHWLDKWLESLKALIKEEEEDTDGCPYIVFIDDCRYENEIETIQRLGGKVYFINPGERELPESQASWRKHESEMLANHALGNWEKYQSLFNGIIYNDGSIERLNQWAYDFFNIIIHFPGDWDDVCNCEACNSLTENRIIDETKLLEDIEKALDNFEQMFEEPHEEEDNDGKANDGNS